jgi:alkaline phosphatase D
MSTITRRELLAAAAAFGASLAWAGRSTRRASDWRERRDLYPQGVASGDPQATSVLLWTRRPPAGADQAIRLVVEVASDPDFQRVVAHATAPISAENDWTCRVLIGNLSPRTVYWYRFTDANGNGSRIGRTVTAPARTDGRPVRFAFVSCQNVQQGACNAYRRMIHEDERLEATTPDERLGFVLHLGDFVYEIVWYPEDRPQGMYDRRLRDIVRYANGEKHADFHVPTTVDDYRALYQAYLSDPDLQDARARWPFVCMWDNHEFSWRGWQSQQNFGQGAVPAQTRKAAANQAWFEYQPARVVKPGDPTVDRFVRPVVADAPLRELDANGLGLDPGNLAAIGSLHVHRALEWGRHVDLILTDNRSFRSEPVLDRAEAAALAPKGFPYFVAQDVVDILDAGRTYRGGHAPATIRLGDTDHPNPRRDAPPPSILGAPQKRWFLDRLQASRATWKLWGNSIGALDWRTDFQNLPADVGVSWPSRGYALSASDDWSAYRAERNEILELVRTAGITGVASIAGDRHSFNAGLLSTALPPEPFAPVAAEFITGSVSAPGIAEAAHYGLPVNHPLRALYLQPRPDGTEFPAINVLLMHGVKASMALARTGDPAQALAARNPDVAPHLAFVDTGGHGYSVVRASADALEVEFVCIPRPIERSAGADGGPLAYRVRHRVPLWKKGEAPSIQRVATEGTLPLVV